MKKVMEGIDIFSLSSLNKNGILDLGVFFGK
jgi:hypothetical protein